MNRQQRRAAERRIQRTSGTSLAPDELFRAAVASHQAGRLAEAVATCQAVLSASPRHADCLHLYGVMELQLGHAAAAADLIARAIALRPDYAEAHADRGDALAALGQHALAVASYDRAIEIEPYYAEAWCNRGNPLRSLGRFDDAVACYDRALALRPTMPEAWSNRGSALLDLGRHEDAIASFDCAIASRPTMAEAWYNRGVALAKMGRRAAAVESYDRALAVRPTHGETWANRGVALFEMERPADAVTCYDRAIELRPDLAEAWYNRGNALQMLGQFGDALQSYDQAVALRADYPEALSERIHVRYLSCDWRHRPEDDAVLIDLVHRNQTVAPFLLLATAASPADQLRCARQWATRFAQASGPFAGSRPRDPHRPLTLGYLSGDFRQHPLAYLITDLLERHDRKRFKVICYNLRADDGSAIRRRLAAACDRFVELQDLADLSAAQAIASDQVDVLVDLSGYTRSARSGVLAHRPAPVQVSYLGYIGSMGADFIDYVIGDAVALPMDQQQYYQEKIVHLPVCYQPNGTSRQVSARRFTRGECGLPERGFVFCCFNGSHKLGPDDFAIWLRLLARVPGSVLWLGGTNPPAEANLRREAADRGINPERLVFAPQASYPEYLARCALGDLFLDTQPYNAGATASDMLWVGLPLVTRIGCGFAGRMAASVLTACELSELVAESDAAYEALALRLATEPAELARVCAALRGRGHASALFDPVRGTRHLEAAYTEMWRRHCDGLTPANLAVSEAAAV